MELVLPEAIVSLAMSADADCIILRSGSGHVWIAGIGPDGGSPAASRFHRQNPGAAKLRRLHTFNRYFHPELRNTIIPLTGRSAFRSRFLPAASRM